MSDSENSVPCRGVCVATVIMPDFSGLPLKQALLFLGAYMKSAGCSYDLRILDSAGQPLRGDLLHAIAYGDFLIGASKGGCPQSPLPMQAHVSGGQISFRISGVRQLAGVLYLPDLSHCDVVHGLAGTTATRDAVDPKRVIHVRDADGKPVKVPFEQATLAPSASGPRPFGPIQLVVASEGPSKMPARKAASSESGPLPPIFQVWL